LAGAAAEVDGAVEADAGVEAADTAAVDCEAVDDAGGVATARVAVAGAASAATGVSFLGTLVAWLALGVSAGDVLEVPLAPRVTAVPLEFWTRAAGGGV
jgi:hypothetical protein